MIKFDIAGYLGDFSLDGANKTSVEFVAVGGQEYPRFVNEFWTRRQRQAARLHEIAYRACFKPQLPRFFIEPLTIPGDIVYDPFSGRGTTIIEAGLLGRNVIANDINPLSVILSAPRFFIPSLDSVAHRLAATPVDRWVRPEIDLSMFYHPRTLAEIVSLKNYLCKRRAEGVQDDVDDWIQMVATNRLTGHSAGFFSAYTLPPNQAVSPDSQIKINSKRKQKPPYRDTRAIILKKTRQLISGLGPKRIESLAGIGRCARFLNSDARETYEIPNSSVQLTVTSPPFLDLVHYAQDNWLRCWFNTIDVEQVAHRMTNLQSLEEWMRVMGDVFRELYRVTRGGGWVAFEVGEVRKGTLRLDEYVVPLGRHAGFRCEGILVNQQRFSKTANIWGIRNNSRGTNTNRVVVFHKK